MWLSKIPNDKNIKSCDQNDETIWSHDLTRIQFRIIKRLIAFEISCGDVDSLVIFVIVKKTLKICNKIQNKQYKNELRYFYYTGSYFFVINNIDKAKK